MAALNPPMPWTAIAALDQGIREDSYGLGSFRAPRSGYQHSGIDYLMPLGTALRSPCDGAYLAGYDGGYGNWAQVVCQVPASLAGGTTVYASSATTISATSTDGPPAGKLIAYNPADVQGRPCVVALNCFTS